MVEKTWEQTSLLDLLNNNIKNRWTNSGMKSTWLDFSKGFTYQNQNLDTVHTSAEDSKNLNHQKMEKYLWITIPTDKSSKDDIKKYIETLDTSNRDIFRHLIVDEWYSYNDAVAYMWEKDRFKNPLADGTWIFEEKNSTLYDSAGWIRESVISLPKFVSKVGVDATAWVDKILWISSDENREYKQDWAKKVIDDFMSFWDKESKAFQNANELTDIAQLLIPSEWFIWWIKTLKELDTLRKYKKAEWLINFIQKDAKELPTLQRRAKRILQWGDDVMRYNAENWEYTSPLEFWLWSAINVLFGGLTDLWRFVWKKLWLAGLMSPAKAKEVWKAANYEWWATIIGNARKWKVGDMVKAFEDWFKKRPFLKWTKDQIAQQLDQYSDTLYKIKNEVLNIVTDRFESKETSQILNSLIKNMKSSEVYREDVLAELEALIREDNMYTLTEIESAIRHLDKSELSPFLKVLGKYKNDETSLTLKDWRQKATKLVEDVADERQLGDIRGINREIIIANKASEWISQKAWLEELKGSLWIGVPTAAISYALNWDIWSAFKALSIWALSYVLWWTYMRTRLARWIQKLTWEEKVAVTNWLKSNWREALSNVWDEAIQKLLRDADENEKKWLIDYIINSLKEYTKKTAEVKWANTI